MAAARMGSKVAVITQNLDTIGQMSCNPAIGGLGKGHIVREIDALGGAMGLNTDATGIQFRMLNASKGPSVRAPRAQCDKKEYQFKNNNISVHDYKIILTSKLTNLLVKDIVNKKTKLPTVQQTRNVHRHLFEMIVPTLGEKYSKKVLCPIT